MWNYYVQNGHYEGYAIGFDLYKFLKTFDAPSKDEMDSFSVYQEKYYIKRTHNLKLWNA